MIVIRDQLNARLGSLASFHSSLEEFGPDVAVVSGLHLLAGLPFEVQERQVKAVVQGLSTISASVPVHLELASMADRKLMALVVHNVFPYVDSLGLNEQELNATILALDTHLGPGVTPSDPRGISSALEALHTIFASFRFPAWSAHFLTRIHFHCLAFHAVAQRNDLNGRTRWTQASSAVLEGARMASVRACGENGTLRPQDVDLLFQQQMVKVVVANERFDVNMETPVTAYNLTSVPGMSFAVAPVAVCKKPTRTVGLGDAISAAGLVQHIKLS
jgi:ADP-dependent glucokinase